MSYLVRNFRTCYSYSSKWKPNRRCQDRTGTSLFLSPWYSTKPDISEGAGPFAAGGSEVEHLVSTFLTLTTKKERFSFAKNVCKSSKLNRFNISCLNEVQRFYGVLRKDITTSSVDEVIDLMEHFVDAQDPFFVNVLSAVLCKRAEELDFEVSLHLAEMFTKVKLESRTVPIFKRLKTLFSGALEEDSKVVPPNIYNTIKVLRNTPNFGPYLGLCASNLSRHLPTFDLEYASMIAAIVAKNVYLNNAEGNLFVDTVKSYILNMFYEIPPTEGRLGKWGKSYGINLSNFMAFYGRIKRYDSEIVNVMKELLYGPEDSEIHNPRFISRFLSLCSKVRYYEKELFNYIIKISLPKLGDFSCVELGIMLFAFSHLNHEHSLLLDETIKISEEKFQDTPDFYLLYWEIMKSCLFMDRYHPAVLQRFLSDDVIKGIDSVCRRIMCVV